MLGWVDFNAGCSCGGLVGGGRSTRISSLSLCLEVYLLSTVWFGTHPLLLQIFLQVMSLDFCCTCYFLLFPGFLEICEVVVSISTSFLLLNYDLVLFQKQVHLRLEFSFESKVIFQRLVHVTTRFWGVLLSYVYFIFQL